MLELTYVVAPSTVRLPLTIVLPATTMFSDTFNWPAIVTSSGNPIVTVPFDLATVVSFDVAAIAITAPVVASLRDTAPEDISKSPLSNFATPLMAAVASKPAIVIVFALNVADRPVAVPVTILKVSPRATSKPEPVFAARVMPSFNSSALITPLSLIVTAPLDTEKLSEWNEATPLLDVVASSPAMVTVFAAIVISMPSPSLMFIVSPSAKSLSDPVPSVASMI